MGRTSTFDDTVHVKEITVAVEDSRNEWYSSEPVDQCYCPVPDQYPPRPRAALSLALAAKLIHTLCSPSHRIRRISCPVSLIPAIDNPLYPAFKFSPASPSLVLFFPHLPVGRFLSVPCHSHTTVARSPAGQKF